MLSHLRNVHLRIRAGTLLVLFSACLSACAGNDRETLPVSLLRAAESDPRVLQELWPGDEVDVRYRGTPELNAIATIRPDGSINLPLVGKLQAEGQTPEELELAIERRCAIEVRNPDASVIVTGFEGRSVHVGGEVVDPGRFVMSRPMRLLESLILAGGPRETAHLESVLVLRLYEGRTWRVFEVDLQSIIDGRADGDNVLLRPTDVVFVPRSPIANVNRWVDQYVRQNLPFNVSIRPDIGVDR